ncbi:MAG: peptidylprolyl isomerase [Sphaerochaetaceae bacterium]
MKKSILIVVIILMLSPLVAFGADAISTPVATVNLIRQKVITTQQLNQKLAEYQAEAKAAGSSEIITQADVLQIMINDELVLQGAERDGFLVSDSQVNQMIAQQRAYLEQQVGKAVTDQQFEAFIKNTYNLDLQQFKQSMKETAIVDSYVRGKMAAELNLYDKPTEAQINEFFRANRSRFMNPELVRLSHIFMPFTDSDKAEIKKQMDQVARYLRYDTYTFEELVPKYSQDKDSVGRGGDIGWLAYDDEQMRSYLGPQFFEAVFALQLGKPSAVLESNGGYHIVKVTTHTEPRLLGLTDYINPDSKVTVKSYIEQTLTSRNQQNAYLKAIEKLVLQLRQSATITNLLGEQG